MQHVRISISKLFIAILTIITIGSVIFFYHQNTAHAETSEPIKYGLPDIRVGYGLNDGFSNPTTIGFGGSKWQVIGYNDGKGISKGVNSGGSDTMTVLLKKGSTYRTTPFNYENVVNTYSDSLLQKVMQTGTDSIYNSFTDKEKSLIVPRDLTENISPPAINQYVWPLGNNEVYNLKSELYAFDSVSWWLREPGTIDIEKAMYATKTGAKTTGVLVTSPLGVRPAITLNTSNVVFTTSSNAKSSLKTGTLAETSSFGESDVLKLTVKDPLLQSPTSTASQLTATAGGILSIPYANISTGSNNYVSCILEDSTGDIAYYAKLANTASTGAGTANLTLPEDMYSGKYTLKLFSERQMNADSIDYMSEFAQDIELTVKSETDAPRVKSTNPANKAVNVSVKTGKISVTFNQPMDTTGSGTVELTSTTGDAILSTPQWNNQDRTISYDVQTGSLKTYTEYTFNISGFENKDGVTMTPESSRSFMTGIGVSGKVTKKISGVWRGAEGATVALTSDSSIATTTDSNGSYTLEGVPPGTGHTVTVSLKGYGTKVSESFQVIDKDVTDINVNLDPIEKFEVEPFIYEVKTSATPSVKITGISDGYKGGTVQGEVTDPDGNETYKVVEVLLPSQSALEYLECENAEELVYINVSGSSNIKDLSVTNCESIGNIYCYNSGVVNIRIEDCPNWGSNFDTDPQPGSLQDALYFKNCESLETFTLINTRVASVDFERVAEKYPNLRQVTLTEAPGLVIVNVSKTNIEKFTISDCPNLGSLVIAETKVTEFSAQNCPLLMYLDCSSAQLSVLNLKDCPNLFILFCSNNHLLDIQLHPDATFMSFDGSGQTVREFMTSDRAQGYMSNRIIEFGARHNFNIDDTDISYKLDKRIHSPKLGTYDFSTAIPDASNTPFQLSGTIELYSASYKVEFVDWDNSVIDTQTVGHGGAALAPTDPTRSGYTFNGWSSTFDRIISDTTIKATYNAIPDSTTPAKPKGDKTPDKSSGNSSNTGDYSVPPTMIFLLIFSLAVIIVVSLKRMNRNK